MLEGSERWLWGVGVWSVIRKEWDLVKGKVLMGESLLKFIQGRKGRPK